MAGVCLCNLLNVYLLECYYSSHSGLELFRPLAGSRAFVHAGVCSCKLGVGWCVCDSDCALLLINTDCGKWLMCCSLSVAINLFAVCFCDRKKSQIICNFKNHALAQHSWLVFQGYVDPDWFGLAPEC